MQQVIDDPQRVAGPGELRGDYRTRDLPDYDREEFAVMLQCDRTGHNHSPDLVLSPEEILQRQDDLAEQEARKQRQLEECLRRSFRAMSPREKNRLFGYLRSV